MYWAGMYGEKELVYLFMKGIGLSPFSKLYHGLSAVTACVQGHQVELLKALCVNAKLFEHEDKFLLGEKTEPIKKAKYKLEGSDA